MWQNLYGKSIVTKAIAFSLVGCNPNLQASQVSTSQEIAQNNRPLVVAKSISKRREVLKRLRVVP